MEEIKPEELAKEVKVTDLLKEISEQQKQIIAEKKDKAWKIPRKGKISNSKARKGWATFHIIRNNGEQEWIKAPITDGTAKIEGFPRIATIDYRLSYNGKPYYIIPEWSMKPFSPIEHKEETERSKMDMVGRKLILSKLEGEQIKAKKSFGSMGWIILVIAIGVGAWYLMKGGKLF